MILKGLLTVAHGNVQKLLDPRISYRDKFTV